MSDRLVISIDSSTTACKAIAWDRAGNAVAEGRASYPMLQPQPTWGEQDAEDWWRSACTALRDCAAQVDTSKIEALGITHQRETFVPVDADGRPLRNAILWLDERSRRQVAWMEQTFGRDALHRLTGKPPSMTQSLPKIIWLVEHEPEVMRRAHKIVDVHAFLVHRLTGHWRTGLANADPMALVDMENRRWAVELIEGIGLRAEQFVDLVPPGTIIGHIHAAAAMATGLPAGLPVVAGAGDGHCAGLGANAIAPGRSYLNLGTAVVSGVISADYVADRAFRTLYAPTGDGYFLEHVLRGGVYTVGWFVDKFAADLRESWLPLSAEEMLEAAAAKVPPGSQGLMLVPYWNNVMNPYWDPAASGITIGWTGAHGREHLYRAVLEGIAYEQRLVGDAMMAAAGQRFTEYVTMGGGSRSDLWCQIVADVTGVPVVRSTTTEATCLGAGILAATAVGWYPDAAAAADVMGGTGRRFDPQPATQAVYDRLYREVYQPLFPTVQPLVDRLTALTHGEQP
jgi:sugar (pentulose or hexulose) kinase